jgi:hypothetical protein
VAEGLSTRRFDLAGLLGLSDIIFRFDLVPSLPLVGRGYLGNQHFAGLLVLEGIRVEMQ